MQPAEERLRHCHRWRRQPPALRSPARWPMPWVREKDCRCRPHGVRQRARRPRRARLGGLGGLQAPAGSARHVACARGPCRARDGGRHHRLRPRGCLPPRARVLRQHRAREASPRPISSRTRDCTQRSWKALRGDPVSRSWVAPPPPVTPPTSTPSTVMLADGRALARATAGGGRRSRLAPARGGRYRRCGLAVPPDRHRHHRPAREAALLARGAEFPSGGAVRHPPAHG